MYPCINPVHRQKPEKSLHGHEWSRKGLTHRGSFGPDVSSFRFGRRTQELRSVAARHDFWPVGGPMGFCQGLRAWRWEIRLGVLV